MERLKIEIDFIDLEYLKNTQLDLIDLLQCSINSDMRNECGFYVLGLLKGLSEKIYDIADRQPPIKPTARQSMNKTAA
jgi:hypothetical protein